VRLKPFSIPLLGALVGAGCSPAAQPPLSRRQPVAVLIGVAEVVDLPATFETGGVVRARATAPIASRVMAPVAVVHVSAGDRVRRGAPLVTLDAREMKANSLRAAAALSSAAEAAAAAESDVRAAAAAVGLARVMHQRIDGLHARRSATAQELDQAVAALDTARAQLAAAERRSAAAVAFRDAARAAADASEIGVSYTVLSAPFDGVVAERVADPGTMAVPGAPLLTLEDVAAFRLEVQVDEARATVVRVGQTVETRIDDRGGTDPWIAARVAEVARIDSATHSFVVKLDLPDNPALRSGAFGRARFAGRVRQALAVPASSIVRRGQLTLLFAVDADGLARLRPVTTGAPSGDRIEILAGVRPGDRIVLNPPSSLIDGATTTGVLTERAR
jgi:HlyD family secretion protein